MVAGYRGGGGGREGERVPHSTFPSHRHRSVSLLVSTMIDHFSAAFGTAILAEYDARTYEALSRLVSTLPAAVAQNLLAQLDEAFVRTRASVAQRAHRHLSHQA